MLKRLVVVLGVVFWPVHLLFANTPLDFLHYLVPALFLWLSYFVFRVDRKFYLLPLLFIPIFEPKLAPVPLLACLLEIVFYKSDRVKWGILLLSLVLLLLSRQGFVGQTILRVDNDSRQAIIGKSYLYPNPFLARVYQNKARIWLDRINNNFF